MPDPTPTPRQREVYDVVERYISEHGYPPTVREIADALEIKSPNGVMCHLKALEKRGWIERGEKSSRSIRLMRESVSRVDVERSSRIYVRLEAATGEEAWNLVSAMMQELHDNRASPEVCAFLERCLDGTGGTTARTEVCEPTA